MEGPGRRVGYDDLTAIDWIFEYAKERQRQRVLYSNTSGIAGYFRQLADASQIWWVLIATGIAAGLVAAFIDVASDWLADLKGGVCGNVQQGGKFYLSKAFCCWGYSQLSQCKDWRSWGQHLGVSNAAGTWIVEFIAFVILSVSGFENATDCPLTCSRLYSLFALAFLYKITRYMRSIAVYPR